MLVLGEEVTRRDIKTPRGRVASHPGHIGEVTEISDIVIPTTAHCCEC